MASEPAAGIPLSVPVLGGNEWAYVKECLDSSALTVGPMLERFAEALRQVTQAPLVVPCASGTAGLHLALIAVGVRPGDLVIVPTLTFAATVNAVIQSGAEPVFVGCDAYMNMDPDVVRSLLAEECDGGPGGTVLRATGQRVAAILPVHVFGNPCQMGSLLEIAHGHGIRVIEDAAESLGSTWTSTPLARRHTGTVGDIGVLSFNGNKIVTTGGGGAILTSDAALARRVAYLADQAKDDRVRFVHGDVGFNYRLGAISAAIGLAQLERLDAIMTVKRRNAEHYARRLSGWPGLRMLDSPPGTAPNHWFHALIIEPDAAGYGRETLYEHLARLGIESRPLWYPNHLQRPFAGSRTYGVDRAVWFWERVLSLPCSADLSPDGVDRVCDAIEAL